MHCDEQLSTKITKSNVQTNSAKAGTLKIYTPKQTHMYTQIHTRTQTHTKSDKYAADQVLK